jgi:hypothetical protein
VMGVVETARRDRFEHFEHFEQIVCSSIRLDGLSLAAGGFQDVGDGVGLCLQDDLIFDRFDVQAHERLGVRGA